MYQYSLDLVPHYFFPFLGLMADNVASQYSVASKPHITCTPNLATLYIAQQISLLLVSVMNDSFNTELGLQAMSAKKAHQALFS